MNHAVEKLPAEPIGSLQSMDLHDVLTIEDDGFGHTLRVRRVPGGWIYEQYWERTYTTNHPYLVSTFVPEPN